MQLSHAPLFAGLNGFGLAADQLGWQQPFHCEIDQFCQKVIQYYWPDSTAFYDIRKTDFNQYKNAIDVVSAGFPCQPFSTAGKRLGKKDVRHLWPETIRALREIKPPWFVGENVYGIINWSKGLVFEEVHTDLEKEGYTVQSIILPACSVNAPHRRDRVWFVAHSAGNRRARTREKTSKKSREKGFQKVGKLERRPEGLGSDEYATNPNQFNGDIPGSNSSQISQYQTSEVFSNNAPNSMQQGLEECKEKQWEVSKNSTERKNIFGNWEGFPSQSPVCGRNDGLSSQLDGITFSKWRQESVKAYGNAIVPKLALKIFNVIQQVESGCQPY